MLGINFIESVASQTQSKGTDKNSSQSFILYLIYYQSHSEKLNIVFQREPLTHKATSTSFTMSTIRLNAHLVHLFKKRLSSVNGSE